MTKLIDQNTVVPTKKSQIFSTGTYPHFCQNYALCSCSHNCAGVHNAALCCAVAAIWFSSSSTCLPLLSSSRPVQSQSDNPAPGSAKLEDLQSHPRSLCCQPLEHWYFHSSFIHLSLSCCFLTLTSVFFSLSCCELCGGYFIVLSSLLLFSLSRSSR